MFGKRQRCQLFLSTLVVGIFAYTLIKTPQTVARSSSNRIEDAAGPQVGRLSPDFTLADVQQQRWTLSEHRGHPMVLAFFCGCDRCHHAAEHIAILQRQHKLPAMVSVVALPPGAARQFSQDTGLQGTMLSDQDDSIINRYDSAFCPRLWGVSPTGIITYRSSIALEGADVTSALHALQLDMHALSE